MKLVANGPDFPSEILQAAEEDTLVFFCGAGISMPHLPGFSDLVCRVFERLGTPPNEFEAAAISGGDLDRALGLLERRLGSNRILVRRAVRDILTLPSIPPVPTHE